MVGLCGVAGTHQYDIDEMIQKLIYLDDEKRNKYSDSNIKIGSVFFKKSLEQQPVSINDNLLLWFWGDLYGFEGPSGYITKDDFNTSALEFCAQFYNKHGIGFIAGLNGVFAGILYNQERKVISLFTDRLSTHPIFFTKTNDGVIFSTQIQSIPFYPSVITNFDVNYLSHFFTFERVLGVKTILKDIEKVHPASILSYDLNSKKLINTTYWYPRYKPRKRSYKDIVHEFLNIFRTIIKEKIKTNLKYGLFLSGGSDSRLILAMIKDVYPDIDLICYHLNESMNREAKIAKKVAEICQCEFKFLKRGLDYHEKVLELTSPLSIYQSWFDHSHFIGYREKINKEVDLAINGNYSDTILKRNYLPKKTLKIPFLNEYIYLSSFLDVKSFDKHVELYMSGQGSYCRDGKIPCYLKNIKAQDIYNSLKSECKQDDKKVIFHGVEYPSFKDFLHWWSFYPITNAKTYLVYYSEIQSYDSFTPFLDNRIINFTLSLPDNIVLKKSIINSAIKRINPLLAEIPHGGTNITLKHSMLLHMLYGQYDIAKCKLFPNQRWQGPWGDIGEIFRQYDFIKNIINENKELIHRCDFLDWDQVKRCYLEHIQGKNNTNQLLALLTFIKNPLTKYLINNS